MLVGQGVFLFGVVELRGCMDGRDTHVQEYVGLGAGGGEQGEGE